MSLYGAETRSLAKTLEKNTDGCHTHLLHHTLNVNWSTPITNTELYGDLPKVSEVIRRRLKFAGHCYRATRECLHHVLFWQPSHGSRGRGKGKPARTYFDFLLEDTGCSAEEMKYHMKDRKL